MIFKAYIKLNVFINNILSISALSINKAYKKFFVDVMLLFLSISGNINFLQLERYSNYCEQRYRQQFEKKFNFMVFNSNLVKHYSDKQLIIAFDPSYIPKSGKSTYGVDKFWSGVAQQAKWGLEISGIAAVDVDNHTAFHLNATQTPDWQFLNENSMSILDWYAKLIEDNSKHLLDISEFLAADAFFSKKPFVDKIAAQNFFLVSRLRNDAVLRYLYTGPRNKGKGRPKQYAGKIDIKNIDQNYFEKSTTINNELMFCGIVNSKALKRKIKLCMVFNGHQGKKSTPNLYFSTNLDISGEKIYQFYQNRFQIEFLYRDAKQYTGLNSCQARSENKLNFHFNASLTSINIAKVLHWLPEAKIKNIPFSMADIKTMYHNELLINRFIDVFGINANSTKNQQIIKELICFGTIAA